MTLRLFKYKFIYIGCLLMVIFSCLKILGIGHIILPIAFLGVSSLYYGFYLLIKK
jgi:hypothetical protein